jgi:hypothetical protein
MQLLPPMALFFLSLDGGLLFVYPFFGSRIFTQPVFESGNGISQLFQGLFTFFELRFKFLKGLVRKLFSNLRGQMRLPVFLFSFELSSRVIELLDFDLYAEAGCCKWVYDHEDVNKTLRWLKGEGESCLKNCTGPLCRHSRNSTCLIAWRKKIMYIVEHPDMYKEFEDEIHELTRQVSIYDTYAQTGYLGMGVCSIILGKTMQRLLERAAASHGAESSFMDMPRRTYFDSGDFNSIRVCQKAPGCPL